MDNQPVGETACRSLRYILHVVNETYFKNQVCEYLIAVEYLIMNSGAHVGLPMWAHVGLPIPVCRNVLWG